MTENRTNGVQPATCTFNLSTVGISLRREMRKLMNKKQVLFMGGTYGHRQGIMVFLFKAVKTKVDFVKLWLQDFSLFHSILGI